MATQAPRTREKALGAFYTPSAMAQMLVNWAVRRPTDRVLDPSFGGLAFLRAAAERLSQLGASKHQIREGLFGAELDDEAYAAALADPLSLDASRLIAGDFFHLRPPSPIPRVDAVVGNPPYVRYQGFNARGSAGHDRAADAGVSLTRLASSWAPFLVHASAFVAGGGRMAQVVPAELLHAQYADQVIDHLRAAFRRVVVVSFEERVFPGVLQEVVLLLADGRGKGPGRPIQLINAPNLASLDLSHLDDIPTPPKPAAKRARDKLLLQILPPRTQALYARIERNPEVTRLGKVCSIDIGAVTGANEFFLLAEGEEPELSRRLLRPTVSKAAHIRGMRFSLEDLDSLRAGGSPWRMFVAKPDSSRALISSAERFLARGVAEGVNRRYKCRSRDPWWSVPLPSAEVPDLFLTYCASSFPRMVVNEAGALHTNTVHGVRLLGGETATRVALGFYNSLTLLSAELVGRSYGGGVLKLEPTEAEALLLPPLNDLDEGLMEDVDRAIRTRQLEAALDLIDPLVLGQGLRLSFRQIGSLRAAAKRLRGRRLARGRAPR